MNPDRFRLGFFVAAAVNLVGMLAADLLAGSTFSAVDPVLFGASGRVMIMIWGLAYLACGITWPEGRWVPAAFAVENLFYFGSWVVFIRTHGADIPAIAATNALAGGFFRSYGLIDGAFGVFFVAAVVLAPRAARTTSPRGTAPREVQV